MHMRNWLSRSALFSTGQPKKKRSHSPSENELSDDQECAAKDSLSPQKALYVFDKFLNLVLCKTFLYLLVSWFLPDRIL